MEEKAVTTTTCMPLCIHCSVLSLCRRVENSGLLHGNSGLLFDIFAKIVKNKIDGKQKHYRQTNESNKLKLTHPDEGEVVKTIKSMSLCMPPLNAQPL